MFARTIDLVKWNKSIKTGVLWADASTSLNTNNDTLSVWKVSNEQELGLAAIAYLTSRDFKLTSIHVTWIEEGCLISNNIKWEQENASTKISNMVDKHFNLIGLKHDDIGAISNLIIQQIVNNKFKFFTEKNVKDLLINSIENNTLDIEDLPRKVKKVLKEEYGI